MTDIVSVYATFGSEDQARSIARLMVEEGLAACANVLPQCHSVYRWQGQVEEASEYPVILKTAEAKAQNLIDRIAELHSYDVPAAVIWPIANTLEPYHSWVLGETTR